MSNINWHVCVLFSTCFKCKYRCFFKGFLKCGVLPVNTCFSRFIPAVLHHGLVLAKWNTQSRTCHRLLTVKWWWLVGISMSVCKWRHILAFILLVETVIPQNERFCMKAFEAFPPLNTNSSTTRAYKVADWIAGTQKPIERGAQSNPLCSPNQLTLRWPRAPASEFGCTRIRTSAANPSQWALCMGVVTQTSPPEWLMRAWCLNNVRELYVKFLVQVPMTNAKCELTALRLLSICFHPFHSHYPPYRAPTTAKSLVVRTAMVVVGIIQIWYQSLRSLVGLLLECVCWQI